MGILNLNPKRKVGIITLGCRVNQYESESLAEALQPHGYRSVPFSECCDLYIINTCAVTEESVRKSRQMVRRAVKKNPNAIVCVCGCAAQLSPETFSAIDGVSLVFGTRNKQELIKAVAEFKQKTVSVEPPIGELSPTRITSFNRTRAYVKIQDGCNGKCAYCIIPHVRGTVVLRSETEIVEEVRALAVSGCREVVLTGIETAAYGERLLTLLRKIAVIDGIERIRLGSLEPSFLKPAIVDALIAIPKVCPHFHLSVQNGSDAVLHRMRRKYNVATLERNATYIRSVLPTVNFSADIIVGFPGETEEDFVATAALLRRIGFLHLHVFTYSKRPGTEAAAMPEQIEESIKAERLHRLEALAADMKEKRLCELITQGEPLTILAETFSDGCLIGHTDSFVECAVALPFGIRGESLRGQFVRFLPKTINKGYLFGEYCRL